MTHDELLAKLSLIKGKWTLEDVKITKALRAVVQLHGPIHMKMPQGAIYCMGCDHEFDEYWIKYPCPTIQAIEKELN